MFGQNNQQQNDQIPEHSIEGALQDAGATAQDVNAQVPPQPVATTVVQPNGDQASWGHPGVPLDAPLASTAAVSPPVDNSHDAAAQPTEHGNDALIDIKQKALTQLTPLVGHLEQTPEEKFRTTMMMIQASDDQSLVPVAYEAANAIIDEKAKAQALLDIVNEINYFTQHHQS